MVAYFKDQKSMSRHCKNLFDYKFKRNFCSLSCFAGSYSNPCSLQMYTNIFSICIFSYKLVLMLMPKDRMSNYSWKRLFLKSLLYTMNSEIFKEKDQIG